MFDSGLHDQRLQLVWKQTQRSSGAEERPSLPPSDLFPASPKATLPSATVWLFVKGVEI